MKHLYEAIFTLAHDNGATSRLVGTSVVELALDELKSKYSQEQLNRVDTIFSTLSFDNACTIVTSSEGDELAALHDSLGTSQEDRELINEMLDYAYDNAIDVE